MADFFSSKSSPIPTRSMEYWKQIRESLRGPQKEVLYHAQVFCAKLFFCWQDIYPQYIPYVMSKLSFLASYYRIPLRGVAAYKRAEGEGCYNDWYFHACDFVAVSYCKRWRKLVSIKVTYFVSLPHRALARRPKISSSTGRIAR